MNLKLSKKSCRSLDVNGDGSTLWVVGRSKAMLYVLRSTFFLGFCMLICIECVVWIDSTVDVERGVLVDTRKRAHE